MVGVSCLGLKVSTCVLCIHVCKQLLYAYIGRYMSVFIYICMCIYIDILYVHVERVA